MAAVRGNGDKRKRILDAAVVEIAQRGYYNTTVAMIARRAGVADGTIYLYFENKDAILFALFDRAMDRFIEKGRAQIPRRLSAEQKLRRIIELHLALVGEDRDLAIITQVELRHSLHFMGQLSRNQVREYLGIIADVVAQGQAEGVFTPEAEPLLAAKAIFGVLDEMATDWVLSRRNVRLESKAEALAGLILSGVRLHS